MPRSRPFPGLVSLNGNLLCAIDVETTGTDPRKHDVIEIAVLPLDNQFKPSKLVLPFNMTMQPSRPENINLDALEVNRQKLTYVMTNSLSADKVADFLVEWFERLNLGIGKRLSPLAHNWPFDREMIIEWLGNKTFELIFDGRFRDTMSLALSMNDCAEQTGNLCPYPKVNLVYLASQMKIDHIDAHNALPDCRITAEIYAEMVKRHSMFGDQGRNTSQQSPTQENSLCPGSQS